MGDLADDCARAASSSEEEELAFWAEVNERRHAVIEAARAYENVCAEAERLADEGVSDAIIAAHMEQQMKLAIELLRGRVQALEKAKK